MGASTTGHLNGGRIFHRELEEELAAFVGKEACHVFLQVTLCASAVTDLLIVKIFSDKNTLFVWSGIKLSGAR